MLWQRERLVLRSACSDLGRGGISPIQQRVKGAKRRTGNCTGNRVRPLLFRCKEQYTVLGLLKVKGALCCCFWSRQRRELPAEIWPEQPAARSSAQQQLGIRKSEKYFSLLSICLCQVENWSNAGDLGCFTRFTSVSIGCLTVFVSECCVCYDLDYSIPPPLDAKFTGVHFPSARLVSLRLHVDVQYWSYMLGRELAAQGTIWLLNCMLLTAVFDIRKQLRWPKRTVLGRTANHNEITWFLECQTFWTCRVFNGFTGP